MAKTFSVAYDIAANKITYEENGKTCVIAGECVIGVVGRCGDEASLFYIVIPDDTKEKMEDVMSFKTLLLAHAPTALIERFSYDDKRAVPLLFQTSDKPRYISVILSTASGGRHAEKFFSNTLQPLLAQLNLREGRNGYRVHRTDSADSISELVQSSLLPLANKGISQVVILLSGDGGVIDIVNGLASSSLSSEYNRPSISLIPMGTGNALAHSSGVTADKTFGLSTLFRGKSRPLPLFKVSFSEVEAIDQRPERQRDYSMYGAVVCSWGLHAALVADSDTPEYRKYGAERFQTAAKENLFPPDGSLPHQYRGKISILPRGRNGSDDWQRLPRAEHAYVLTTLVSQLEAGFTISPDTTSLEGQLRLVHFGPQNGGGQAVMRIMELAYQGGRHVAEEQVGYEEVDGVKIEFEEDDARFRRVCVDGKIVTAALGGIVEVQKETLSVVDLFAPSDS